MPSLIKTMKAKKLIRANVAPEVLAPMICVIRGQQAFKRNRHRFPKDFAFQLTSREFTALRASMESEKGTPDSSQTAMSSSRSIVSIEGQSMSSQFAMRWSSRRGAAYRPWAFTEHGALMAANILHSERAAQMSVYVVRAFMQMREHLTANAAILRRLAEIDKTLLEHDGALRTIWTKLQPLLTPPPEPPPRRIKGFSPDDE
jgi:hypothetical protein